jgi:hypothetical protein
MKRGWNTDLRGRCGQGNFLGKGIGDELLLLALLGSPTVSAFGISPIDEESE